MRSSVVSSSSTAGFGVKRLLICLAVLVCVGTPVLAAISVGPAGSGTVTFDTAPPAAQWSTILWAGTSGPGTSGAADTFALIDGRVQTNVASAINTALAAVAGNPPAQATTPARWASDSGAHYIFTRPTADNGELIMATLHNDTLASQTQLTIDYDLTMAGTATNIEQVYGDLVYYSLTGAANSWVLIPNTTQTDNTLGLFHKTLTLDLSAGPWAAGSTLYILWVDDNGSGTPDNALEIDHVAFTPPIVPTAPIFLSLTDPTNRSVAQCGSTTFAASPWGSPTPTYQWFHNNVSIPGATNLPYTIASVSGADAGTYFVHAHNSLGDADSPLAILTVTALPPMSLVAAVGTTNPTEIILSFSRAISPAAVAPGNFTVNPRGGGGVLAVNSAFVTNGAVVHLVTEPRLPGTNYSVTLTPGPCFNPSSTGPFDLGSQIYLVKIDAAWQYNQSGVDPGPAWIQPNYSDMLAPWQTGRAIFDGKNTGPRTVLNGQSINTTLQLSNTTTYPNADIPTYLFRTHFTFPGTTNGAVLLVRPFIDDACIFYLNGQQAATVGFTNPPAGPTAFSSYGAVYTSRTATDASFADGYISLPLTNVAAGDNVIAVEVKQERSTSSDITMGLELSAIIPTLLSASPKLNWQLNEFYDLILSWPSGVLQQSSTMAPGSWTDVAGGAATSPFSLHPGPPNTGATFYRVR